MARLWGHGVSEQSEFAGEHRVLAFEILVSITRANLSSTCCSRRCTCRSRRLSQAIAVPSSAPYSAAGCVPDPSFF